VLAALIIIAALMLAAAVAAMVLRNLIHSALLLILTWASVAAFYLWAGAEFVAFAQVLIYVGAISMVVLFAVLLTRRSRDVDHSMPPATFSRLASGVMAAAMTGAIIASAILNTRFLGVTAKVPRLTVYDIGALLMGPHAAALLVVGVILTVALLGAILIAAPESPSKEDQP
jgi:NADH:ubiquinone oxidoreductase subunit 6 (subunit J)